MKNIVLKSTFFLILATVVLSADIIIPLDIGNNLTLQDKTEWYASQNLYGYINGGAELFLEFGFTGLKIHHYKNGSESIDLELYRMVDTTAALGVYLIKAGTENYESEIPVKNTSNPYQILLVINEYFIQINNFTGEKRSFPAMINLAKQLAHQAKQNKAEDLFLFLPEEDLITDSQRIFRGLYGLQTIYTFGNDDILFLNGRIFGVAGNYRTPDSHLYTQLIIPYPDYKQAEGAFSNLIMHLDPYLNIIHQTENTLIFKDYKEQYGWVKLKKNQLSILVHLPSAPEH